MDDSIRYQPDEWTGSSVRLSVGSVHGETGCPPKTIQNALGGGRLPTALVETTDGKVQVYIGSNPSPSPASLNSRKTELRLDDWELWRWFPEREDPTGYHYILVANDGRDPIIYQRADAGECDVQRLKAVRTVD